MRKSISTATLQLGKSSHIEGQTVTRCGTTVTYDDTS